MKKMILLVLLTISSTVVYAQSGANYPCKEVLASQIEHVISAQDSAIRLANCLTKAGYKTDNIHARSALFRYYFQQRRDLETENLTLKYKIEDEKNNFNDYVPFYESQKELDDLELTFNVNSQNLKLNRLKLEEYVMKLHDKKLHEERQEILNALLKNEEEEIIALTNHLKELNRLSAKLDKAKKEFDQVNNISTDRSSDTLKIEDLTAPVDSVTVNSTISN